MSAEYRELRELVTAFDKQLIGTDVVGIEAAVMDGGDVRVSFTITGHGRGKLGRGPYHALARLIGDDYEVQGP